MSTNTSISLYQVRSYCLDVGVKIKSIIMPDILDRLQDIHPSNICMFN